jgi:NTP pyrophosphatase (non-canonical NTP hydrolase)
MAETFLSQLNQKHDELGIERTAEWAQAMNVVGEAGEFAEAYRRYSGQARRVGSREDMENELADVIISAYVFAAKTGIDLDAAVVRKGKIVMTRGVRDSRD